MIISKTIIHNTLKYFDHISNKKIESMIRKYHSHKLQTNPRYREEESHNNHETPGRQKKQSNQLSLPHQNDCKARMNTKLKNNKHRTIPESYNWSSNQQRINNNNRTTALERTAAKATCDLNAFLWYQIFALDSDVVEAKMFSSHGGFLTTYWLK